jgi:transcriptional regulator with XRE-family HTH domain
MRNPKALLRAQQLLGANALRQRTAMGLTQKETALRAGLFWRHYQKIEAGECNVCLSTLVWIASALEVQIHELLVPPQR